MILPFGLCELRRTGAVQTEHDWIGWKSLGVCRRMEKREEVTAPTLFSFFKLKPPSSSSSALCGSSSMCDSAFNTHTHTKKGEKIQHTCTDVSTLFLAAYAPPIFPSLIALSFNMFFRLSSDWFCCFIN